MTLPAVTVATPCYNEGEKLIRAIEAVLAQTRQPDEYLIIDDGSTDGSADVVRGYQKKYDFIKLIVHEKNLGAARTIAELAHLIRTPYGIFSAANDYILPNCLEVALRMLACHPEAAYSFGNVILQSESTGSSQTLGMLPTSRSGYYSPTGFAKLELWNSYFQPGVSWIPMGGAVMRMDVTRSIWLYSESLKWHFDLFICYVLALRHGVCYWPEPVGVVINTDNDFSRGQFTEEQVKTTKEIWRLINTREYADIRSIFLKTGLFRFFSVLYPPIILDHEYQEMMTAIID